MSHEIISALYPLFTAIAAFVIWYTVFILTGKLKNAKKGFGEIQHFIISKTAGLVLFGIVPFFVTKIYFPEIFSEINIFSSVWPTEWYQWFLILGSCGVISLLIWSIGLSKQPEVQEAYPEMRLSEWRPYHIIIVVAGWAIYLAGYEYLFRGILLQGMMMHSGIILAVVVNLILYCLAHFYKKRKEMIASIPFGIVLCILTIVTDSILLPFFLHLTIALSSEMFALRNNKKMHFILFRRS